MGVLHFVQAMVETAPCVKLFMIADLGDLSGVQDDDFVCLPDGGEPVRNYKNRTPFHQRGKRLLHQTLGFGIEMRGCLIQYQNRGVLQ